jgi:hypothetical protein
MGMDKKILFSVTAHESILAINTLVESILYSYPDSYIVFHMNSNWKDFDQRDVKLLNDRVFINKNRFPTVWGYSIGGFHFNNIQYFNSLSINYDFVVLTSSNEMYVKKINIDFLNRSEYGANSGVMPSDYPKQNFQKISKQMNEISLKNGFYSSWHEGMFFTKDISDEMLKVYTHYFGDIPTFVHKDEENMLPTILYNVVPYNNVNGLCFFYHKELNLNLIKSFINNEYIIEFETNYEINDRIDVRYSIKRIPRFDYTFRTDILNLIQNIK